MRPAPSAVRSERAVVWLITAVQFVNILDFVMVMPMGPDFAKALAIPESQLGLVGGAYTAAGAVAGLVGAFFLDRFDRRKALGVAMLGLVIGTAAGSLATGLNSLLAARVLAGLFGGPATSLSFSIIADVIPSERRGKAMALVMSAFSVASVVGVPLGLWFAETLGWRAPFLGVAGMGLVLALGAIFLLPPLTGHLQAPKASTPATTASLLRKPMVKVSYLLTASLMVSGFAIIPNISAYLQGNLGYPREGLKWLYLGGGVASYLAIRAVGGLVDRYGSYKVGSSGAVLVIATLFVFFFSERPELPAMAMFVIFMVAMAARNVSHSTLTSKVPGPFERARFQSIQSAVQHGASAAGAFLSAQMLSSAPILGAQGQALVDERGRGMVRLVGMPRVALFAIALTAVSPLLFRYVERAVRSRDSAQAAPERPAPAVGGG